MARPYKLTPTRKAINFLAGALIRLGLMPKGYYLLTVTGRTTGKQCSLPVHVVESDGARWLVAPYGERNWVKNARANNRVTLRRGRSSETVTVIEEHDPRKSASVLKRYIALEPITARFFEARANSSIEDFVREAIKHPTFKVMESN